MVTAPTGWPLLATGSNDTISRPSGPAGVTAPTGCQSLNAWPSLWVLWANPALTKRSTLLSVLLFPEQMDKSSERVREREAEFTAPREAKCFPKAQ